MTENIVAFILGNTLFYIYQSQIFAYASSTLVNCEKSKFNLYVMPLINTIFYILYYALGFPISLFYITTIFVLGIEFKLISKTNYLQTFCVGAIFAMHICAIHSAVIITLSGIMNMAPIFFIEDVTYRFYVLFLTCSLLIVVTKFVLIRLISTNNVKRVTTAGKYTGLLLFSTVGAVVYQSIHIVLMISTEKYPEQVAVVMATCFVVLVAFYILIMYAVEIVNVSLYKRKSDDALSEKLDIEKKKTDLTSIIEQDELTKVFSRKYILEILSDMCVDKTKDFCILFVDINSLKLVNDTYGHDKGDELIKIIAQCIRQVLRSEDMVGRMGGDEFLIIICDGDERSLDNVTQRIKEKMEIENEKRDYVVMASLGGCVVNEEAKKNGMQYILDSADKAMREDKRLYYKNCTEKE